MKKKTQANLIPCGEAGCDKTFTSPKERGKHRRSAHGIAGQSRGAILRARAKLKAEQLPQAVPLGTNGNNFNEPQDCPYPDCGFKAKWKGGLTLHLKKKHKGQTLPKPGKEKSLAKRTTKAIILNGHAHEEGQDHSNAYGIPPALIAVASGRFTEICRSMAFEFDLPVRSFTARVAEFVHASQVR